MWYSADEEEDEDSDDLIFDHWRRCLRDNRCYDGSACFCKPCPKCYGTWIPEDCFWGPICTNCKNNIMGEEEDERYARFLNEYDESGVQLRAFKSRVALARWTRVRKLVAARHIALFWQGITQESLCAIGGSGRERDLSLFVSELTSI